MTTKQESYALYCPELKELMIDSGRTFRVPDPIAATVNPGNLDTRFVKAWAMLHKLIPASGEVSVLEAQLAEVA
ncbi:hypothetical protein Q1Z72_00810 [Pseudomonas qingdaonensis]|nr:MULTISPECIES: hypothetical protein [Pseudomonas]WKL67249.1 hypothetical protein Q1Z72_00810 [Pseudomonas qingdaonensis]